MTKSLHCNLRWAFVVASFIGVVATALVAIRPAEASNWFGASGVAGECSYASGNISDAEPASFYYSDTSTIMRDASEWLRVNRIAATNLSTTLQTGSGFPNSLTDVIVFDRYYVDYCGVPWGQGVVGMTTCMTLTATNRCEQSNVRFNLTFMDNWTIPERRYNACHEIGHAIGLKHRTAANGGCMESGKWTYTDWLPHDKGHINGEWN